MLCFKHSENGEICTNRCHEWADCPHRKSPSHMRTPFLIEAVDRLVSEIKPEVVDGLYILTYKPYCFTPQAFLNGASDDSTPTNPNDMLLS